MKRFGIIGYPVAGSMSPRLFAAAYGSHYTYDLLEYPTFEQAWDRFIEDYDGINVTAPFKMDALHRVGTLTQNALLAGAVNVVAKRPGGQLLGHNSDVDGIVASLQECGLPISDVLVVGTGGAARAAVAAARLMGLPVTVTGRSVEKAAALTDGSPATQVPAVLPFEDLASWQVKAGCIIYTLPSTAPVPAGLPIEGAVILEAEYKHPQLAPLPCRAYLSGRRWLLHQAIAGYQMLTGLAPDVRAMMQVLP